MSIGLIIQPGVERSGLKQDKATTVKRGIKQEA